MFMYKGLEQYDKCCRYMSEVCTPIKGPQWATDNRIRLELPNVILREFSTGESGDTVFIIPPQAGHHSSIADYDRGKSLVEAALKSGIKSVYAAEWKGATLDRKNETIDDFIVSMRECIRIIDRPVNLIGLCQGGWQSAIYAALYPEDISSLVLAGAPIDFHAGKSIISKFAAIYPMEFFQSVVAMGNGVLDGKFLLTGFKMMNPVERFYTDYMDLYLNIDDPRHLNRYRKFRAWYEYTQNLPGAFYLQVVKDLFKENRLIKGTARFLGQNLDLKKINHPLFLIAGDRDDITPQEQLFNMERYVSSRKIVKITVPAGHIGVFMGKKVIQKHWPRIFEAIRTKAYC